MSSSPGGSRLAAGPKRASAAAPPASPAAPPASPVAPPAGPATSPRPVSPRAPARSMYLLRLQLPVDHRLRGQSSWIRYWQGRDEDLCTDAGLPGAKASA